MDLDILENIGLTKGEAKVYLTLLEIGTTKVGKVILKTNLASSAVHHILTTLREKGFVSYIKKGNVKHFQAAPPSHVLHILEEKRKQFSDILPELELKQKFRQEHTEAEVFEGTKGILTMLEILIEDTRKGDHYYFFATDVQGKNEEVQTFFKRYDAKRKQKKLRVYGFAPKKLETLFQNRPALKVKYPLFPIPSDISICNNKVALIAWGEKPIGYLLHSKEIAQVYKNYFEDVWKRTTLLNASGAWKDKEKRDALTYVHEQRKGWTKRNIKNFEK